MNRHLAPTLFCLLASLSIGCAGSEDDGRSDDPILQRLGESTGLGLEQLASIVERLFELPDAIEDPGMPPVGITYDSMSGALVIEIDFDGDTVNDTTLSGNVVAATGNLTDGFDVGESFTVDWIASGLFTGNGSLECTLLAVGDLQLEGQGSLVATASTFQFSITSPIHFDPRAPTLTPLTGVIGALDFDLSDGGDNLAGTIFPLVDEASVSVEYPAGSGFFLIFYVDYDSFMPYFED